MKIACRRVPLTMKNSAPCGTPSYTFGATSPERWTRSLNQRGALARNTALTSVDQTQEYPSRGDWTAGKSRWTARRSIRSLRLLYHQHADLSGNLLMKLHRYLIAAEHLDRFSQFDASAVYLESLLGQLVGNHL